MSMPSICARRCLRRDRRSIAAPTRIGISSVRWSDTMPVAALGKRDCTIDPARALRGFVPVAGGDLARLLALSKDLVDEDAEIDLAAYGGRPLEVDPAATQFESGGDLVDTRRLRTALPAI